MLKFLSLYTVDSKCFDGNMLTSNSNCDPIIIYICIYMCVYTYIYIYIYIYVFLEERERNTHVYDALIFLGHFPESFKMYYVIPISAPGLFCR
jgi:hypothetical protein